MAQNSDPAAKKQRGRPFQKGQSGNPGGRPKGFAALVREQTNDGREMVDYLLAVARGTATIVHKLKKDDEEVERHQVPDFKERTDAAKLLLAYGFGTPTQYVEHSGEGGGPLQVAINIVRRVRE